MSVSPSWLPLGFIGTSLVQSLHGARPVRGKASGSVSVSPGWLPLDFIGPAGSVTTRCEIRTWRGFWHGECISVLVAAEGFGGGEADQRDWLAVGPRSSSTATLPQMIDG